MKIKWLIILTIGMIYACNLDRIEDQMNPNNIIKFEKTVGGSAADWPRDLLLNEDGSIVVIGSSQSFTSDSNYQLYIVKLDQHGSQVWERNYGGNDYEAGQRIVKSNDGGYIIAAVTQSHSANKLNDPYIVKINSMGDKVWERYYGSVDSSEFIEGLFSIDFNKYLIGYSSTKDNINREIKFLTIDENGSKLSDKICTSGQYVINNMIRTSDNKYVIVGHEIINTISGYMAKIDNDGQLIWERDLEYLGLVESRLYGVVELSNKDLIVTGYYLDDTSSYNFLIAGYSEIGVINDNYLQKWGGANDDKLFNVAVLEDDNIVGLGYTKSYTAKKEIYLIYKDLSSDSIKISHYNECINEITGVKLWTDGGYVFCFDTPTNGGDIRIIKTDENGNYQ